MKNKTLIYLGVGAAAYYLYKKNQASKNILTQKAYFTVAQIQSLSDANLLSLIQDLRSNPNNYADPVNYLNAALSEQQNRLAAGKGPQTTGGNIFSV